MRFRRAVFYDREMQHHIRLRARKQVCSLPFLEISQTSKPCNNVSQKIKKNDSALVAE